MRKFFILFKAITLTSIIALTPVGCGKPSNEITYFDISNISLENITVPVKLNQQEYNEVLSQFKEQLQKKLATFVTTSEKPSYGRDYKINIVNHDLYEKVKTIGWIDIKVAAATTTTHLLLGSFQAQVKLVNPPKSISGIKIEKQTFDNAIANKTRFQDAIQNSLKLIDNKIKNIAATAKINNDYVVNVEDHKLDEIVKEDPNYIVNVNAVTDDKHDLLIDAFSFALVINQTKALK